MSCENFKISDTLQGPPGPPGPAGIQSKQYTINFEQPGQIKLFAVAGVDDTVASAQTTTNYTTAFSVYNNHIFIDISAMTRTIPANDVTITFSGTAISESTAVPILSSEVITLPSTFTTFPIGVQTIKKWLDISSIVFTNVQNITYDIKNLGYVDFLNTDVRIVGYRAEILGDNNSGRADIRLIIIKVDNENIPTNLFELEDIEIVGSNNGADSNKIFDYVRTGVLNRDYSSPNGLDIWPSYSQPGIRLGSDFVLKQTDFLSYWGDSANIKGSANEGIIIRTTSRTSLGGPNGARYLSLTLYYENI